MMKHWFISSLNSFLKNISNKLAKISRILLNIANLKKFIKDYNSTHLLLLNFVFTIDYSVLNSLQGKCIFLSPVCYQISFI